MATGAWPLRQSSQALHVGVFPEGGACIYSLDGDFRKFCEMWGSIGAVSLNFTIEGDHSRNLFHCKNLASVAIRQYGS